MNNPAAAKGRRGQMLRHRGAGIRTRDLLLPKQARYRTAPHPVFVRQQLRRFIALRQAECARLGSALVLFGPRAARRRSSRLHRLHSGAATATGSRLPLVVPSPSSPCEPPPQQ